jgi:hypothetical protein
VGWLQRMRSRLSRTKKVADAGGPSPADAAPGAAAASGGKETVEEGGVGTRAHPDDRSPGADGAEHELLALLGELERSPSARASLGAARILDPVERLVDAGEERRAAELLSRFAAALPREGALRLRLARLHLELKEPAAAAPLLGALAEDPDPRLRIEAHFLLGRAASREADLEAASRHFEAVLALDYTHGPALRASEELRARLSARSSPAAPTLLGNEDLGGAGSRFLLQRELGRGGGGTVYLAHDRSLGRPVAVKVLHSSSTGAGSRREHLFCEARIACSLRHPRIVTVHDLDEKLGLVVMEYCAGGTLAARLAGGPVPLEAALARLGEVASVLGWVHRSGVVHRDLKPANLLLRRPATAAELPPLVLTDFGIAHAGGADPADPAGSGGEAGGTLVYAAPEQRRGERVDARADLYSLGVILVETIAGRPPLSRKEALRGEPLLGGAEALGVVAERTPRAVRAPLLELLGELLEPDPARRPPNGDELAARLARLAGELEGWTIRREAFEELARIAGPPPRRADVERWLGERRVSLGLSQGEP